MYPLKFEPILKQTIWGGDKIIPFKHLDESLKNVGESWEISGVEDNESIVANGIDKGRTLTEMIRKYRGELVGEDNYKRFGERFPILVKFIDAKEDLSIQVHPDDVLAFKRHSKKGKTEMWYVIDTEEDSRIYTGFSEEITPKEFKERVHKNTLPEVIQSYHAKKGDVFYLPAGRIHSIGAGILLAEIQQTSDITYRIYDFDRKDDEGNPRLLHVDMAKEAIDYEVLNDYRTEYEAVMDEPVELVACPHFTTSLYDMKEEISCDYSELDSFIIFMCVEGACTLYDNEKNELTVRSGDTVLFPASTQEVTILPMGAVKLLETYI